MFSAQLSLEALFCNSNACKISIGGIVAFSSFINTWLVYKQKRLAQDKLDYQNSSYDIIIELISAS